MGRQQAIRREDQQDKRRDLQGSTLPRSGSPSTLARFLLIGLLRIVFHPFTILSGAGLLSLSVAYLAATNLLEVEILEAQKATPPGSTPLQTEIVAQPEPLTSSVPAQSSSTSGEPRETLPLLSLLAVGISCASGSLLISRYFLKPQQPPKRLRLSKSRYQPATHPSARPDALAEPAAIPTDNPPLDSQSTSASGSVAATIVPDEESHPLDWTEPSLADHLDLRQRRPLSHWLS